MQKIFCHICDTTNWLHLVCVSMGKMSESNEEWMHGLTHFLSSHSYLSCLTLAHWKQNCVLRADAFIKRIYLHEMQHTWPGCTPTSLWHTPCVYASSMNLCQWHKTYFHSGIICKYSSSCVWMHVSTIIHTNNEIRIITKLNNLSHLEGITAVRSYLTGHRHTRLLASLFSHSFCLLFIMTPKLHFSECTTWPLPPLCVLRIRVSNLTL